MGKHIKGRCAICGASGYVPGRLRRLTQLESFKVMRYARYKGHRLPDALLPDERWQYPIGTMVCRYHETYENKAARLNDEPYPVIAKEAA